MFKNSVLERGLVFVIIVLFIGASVSTISANNRIIDAINNEDIASGGSDSIKIKMKPLILDTLYVGGGGPGNYSKIQDAINDASSGDTVFVYDESSPYHENLAVDKSIHLVGEDRDTTVIDGHKDGDVIFVSDHRVEITGFTIQNSGDVNWDDAGIDIRSDINNIHGNIIDKNFQGIYLGQGSSFNILSENDIEENYNGIYIYKGANNNTFSGNNINNSELDGIVCFFGFCNDSIISGNTFNNNSRYGLGLRGICYNNTISGNSFHIDGIELYAGPSYNIISDNFFNNSYGIAVHEANYNIVSQNELHNSTIELDSIGATVVDNTFTSQGIFILGYDFLPHWDSHIIDNNTINGIPIRYYKELSDVTVPSDTSQVILANCNNFTIQNFNFDSADVGIQLGFSSHNTISENTFDKIRLMRSSNNIIAENTIVDHNWDYNWYDGINLWVSSNNNTISENILNEGGNIELHESSLNKISKNMVCNGGIIRLYGIAEYNIISDNTVSNAGDVAIYLSGCSRTIISGNNVYDSDSGIYVKNSDENVVSGNTVTNNGYGIYIRDSSSNTISRNTITGNDMGTFILSMSNNVIYHNNFVNNSQNAHDADINIWDNGYPSGGNYWDDYNGSDDYHGPNQDMPSGDRIGDTPYNISGGNNRDRYPVLCPDGWSNAAPTAPSINGPTNGKAGVEYDYTFAATDTDGDDVYYYIDWDDTVEDWFGPFDSGEEVIVSHTWDEKGTYTIGAKAKDTRDAEGGWGHLEVTMPLNQPHSQSQPSSQQTSIPLFSQILQRVNLSLFLIL